MAVPLKRGTALIRGADAPLYRQIYEHIRTAISSGQLQPGGRLPSVRRLAEEFATARGTIDAAYAMLAGEGYVVSRGPAGTMVSPALGESTIAKRVVKRRLAEEMEPRAPSAPRPFQMGLPA